MIPRERRQQRASRKKRGSATWNWSIDHGTGHGIQESQPGGGGLLHHIVGIGIREPLKIQAKGERKTSKNTRQVIEGNRPAVDLQRSGNDRFSGHYRPIEQDLIQKLEGFNPEDIPTCPLGLPMNQRGPGIGGIGKNENH